MMKLRLADTLSLPIDACTQTFAWIGRKGSGKTYGAGKLAEELLKADIQTVILDTVGNWYGLRIAENGKDTGFDVPVFGGLRQDVPLLATAGEVVADVVMDSRRSVILDVSQFNFSERKRFAADFGTRLWQRKKSETTPSPLHLIVEECQLIVPQFVQKDDTRMVHVYEEIIRLGRNYGIGASMLTQRPQSVNKEVLTQAECIMAFQINGVPERKALKEWLTYEGGDVNLVNELPGLPVGTCYLWSPQWLRTFQKITIGKKSTLDASATPKAGQKLVRRDPAPLDVKDIERQMSATIEKAKADDPKELRAKIVHLERELNVARKVTPTTSKPEIKEVPVLKGKELAQLESFCTKLIHEAERHGSAMSLFWSNLNQVADSLLKAIKSMRQEGSHTIHELIQRNDSTQHARAGSGGHGTRVTIHSVGDPGSPARLARVEHKFLTVLAQQDRPLTRNQIAIFAGYSAKSRHVDNTLAALRSKQYVVGGREGIEVTESGRVALGHYDPLPIGEDLRQYWIGKLGRAASTFFRVLCEAYPDTLTREELAERSGYSPLSRHVDNTLAQLRSRDLVTGGREALQASKELFQ